VVQLMDAKGGGGVAHPAGVAQPGGMGGHQKDQMLTAAWRGGSCQLLLWLLMLLLRWVPAATATTCFLSDCFLLDCLQLDCFLLPVAVAVIAAAATIGACSCSCCWTCGALSSAATAAAHHDRADQMVVCPGKVVGGYPLQTGQAGRAGRAEHIVVGSL